MEYIEKVVDLRKITSEELATGQKLAQLTFQLNHTMTGTKEYQNVLKELFGDYWGKGSTVTAPISGACLNRLKIGKNVSINSMCGRICHCWCGIRSYKRYS